MKTTIVIAGKEYQIKMNLMALAAFGEMHKFTFTQVVTINFQYLSLAQFMDLLRCALQQGDKTEVFTAEDVATLMQATDLPKLITDLSAIYTECVINYCESKPSKNPKAQDKK